MASDLRWEPFEGYHIRCYLIPWARMRYLHVAWMELSSAYMYIYGMQEYPRGKQGKASL